MSFKHQQSFIDHPLTLRSEYKIYCYFIVMPKYVAQIHHANIIECENSTVQKLIKKDSSEYIISIHYKTFL